MFVEAARALGVTPHVAQSTSKRSSIDERTTVGLLRKLRHRGQRKVGWTFTFTAAVYNLVRMRTLGLGAVT